MMACMDVSSAWAGFPEGAAPVVAVCTDHPSRVLVRRGSAYMFADGHVEITWQLRDGEEPVDTGIAREGGNRRFRLRCPMCGRAPVVRSERLALGMDVLARAGRLDRKGRLVLDIGLLP